MSGETTNIMSLSFQEPMKSRAPQLHLEYRFYKVLGNAGKSYLVIHEALLKLKVLPCEKLIYGVQEMVKYYSSLLYFFLTAR